MKIEFYRHNLSDKDKDEVRKVLDGLFLTTGEWTKTFEDKLAAYLNASYAVGLSSGTNALELCLHYYGIGPGDEVITTPMSFIATANAIEACGAKPVFVDVEASTGNIDAELIAGKISERTKAILPVHLYGQMCDMKRINAIAQKHNVKVIEDSAHCLESERDGVPIGAAPNMACFSFYATKSITSGEGGAITCHDKEAYAWFIKARMHGMSADAADRYSKLYKHYDMEFLGFKCNMNNIAAALLVHQMDSIDTFLEKRRIITEKYNKAFSQIKDIRLPAVVDGSKSAYHLYTIWVDPNKRDEYLHALQDAEIGVAVNYRSIHLMSYYRNKYEYVRGDFPNCEFIGDATITLPLYPQLTDAEVEYIIQSVKEIIK